MKLHEFMTAQREQVIDTAIQHLMQRMPRRERAEIGEGVPAFVDEVIRALRHDDGEADVSSLPGKSPVAVDIAVQRLERGFPIAELAMTFGAVSASVGALGRLHGTTFESGEYEVFDACVDTAVATAVEEYASRTRIDEAYAATERIGFLAHELRNALSTATMAFRVLRENRLPVSGRTADVLERAHARMEELIARALVTTRIEAGIQPTLRAVRVADILHEVEAATSNRRPDVRLVVRAQEDAVALADPSLLTSAVSNLMQNALKFSRAGGFVEARARREGAYVTIEVEDACGGLPPGDPQELFDAFVRRSTEPTGVGLGLAITRDAVELQRGTIRVRDIPGKGCVFTIQLTTPPGAVSEA